jgi:hypothetical protein
LYIHNVSASGQSAAIVITDGARVDQADHINILP